jgi:trimeric autotransporter adhesin
MVLSNSIEKLKSISRRSVALAVLGCLSAILLIAQSYQGGVRGTVTDSTGAPVPNAKVILTNDGTGEARSVLTNSEGGFDFEIVVPTTYTLTAEAPNFKKFERKNITIGAQEHLTVDMQLTIGTVSESVLVTEQVPLVETSDASQGQVLDNQKLSDLPNLGRNPFMMAKLTETVVQVGPPAYNRMEDQSGSSMMSISGGPVRGNNYLVDGIPITDFNNRAIIIPTLEGVQEVKIQANTYDAEMARTGGGMINTLMKSGTNDYHGTAYGHIRRTSMDANNFFANTGGLPIADQPNTTWGASFGGRIWVPHVYDGKNKTFFYLAVEHYDDRSSDAASFGIPTALERVGNFSQSNGITVYQPGTQTVANPNGTPYSGNMIPQSALNPVGLAIAAQYPNPAFAPTSYGGTDLDLTSSIKARAVQYTAKLDEDFTSWWRSSLSYLRYYSLEPGDTWWGESTQSGWRLLRRVDATAINNLFTINPTTVLAVRLGENRFPNFDYNSSQGFNVSTLGFSSQFAGIVSPAAAEFPAINMSTVQSLGDEGDWDYYNENSKSFSTAIDKYIGKHSIKMGFDYRYLDTFGSGVTCPTGCYGFNTGTPGTNSYTGSDLGDLLEGLPFTRSMDLNTNLSDYTHYYGLFIQDNFRVSSKLTVNFGLRWEREDGVQEKNNGLVTGFNTTAVNPIAAQVSGILPIGEIEYAGQNGNPTAVGDYYKNKLGPRAGVAYSINSKTVIRGGYGLFYAPQVYLGGPFGAQGYTSNTSYTGSVNSLGQVVPTLGNPFPTGLVQPVGNALGVLAGLGQSESIVEPQSKSPFVQQYSVDIQRELGKGFALEVGYVGSHSSHLTLGTGGGGVDINALNPSYFTSLGTTALNTPVANPYYGVITTGTISGATVPKSFLLLPYSAFSNIEYIFDDQNHARYDSMIIKVQKRLSAGLTLLSVFTWAKSYDGSFGGVNSSLNGDQGVPQNPYDLGAEYSQSNFNAPLRLATSISYELPIGKGKWLLNNANKAEEYAFGGWSVNGVSVYQVGFPLPVYQDDSNSPYGYDGMRPNATGADPSTSGNPESRIYDYINPAAFSIAPQGTFGNISRTIPELSPGIKNWDLSVFKSVTFKERFKAQFRAEALNAFNSPQFYAPVTDVSRGNFGQITGQANFARQLQMAIRFTF